jgi:SPP1 gp7 family putative phage head morphogenesis protein
MINLIKKIFFKDAQIKQPDYNEIGIDSSILYSAKDFNKWNRDLLMQKKGIGIYRDIMLDEQVKAVVRFKQYATISRKYYFKVDTDEDGKVNEQHKEIADFFEYVIKLIKGSFTDNLLYILSAVPYGYSIVEKIYMPIQYDGRQMIGIRDLKLREYDTFDGGIKIDKHGNIVEIAQTLGAGYIPIPLDKIIHFVNQPDIDRHYGESDLRAIYRPWWCKDITIKFQNIHLERHAGGFIWAKYKGTLSSTQGRDLKDLINNVSSKMGAMLPDNIDLNSFPPLQTDAFDKAIAQHNRAIAKGILVPNLLGLTEQGQHGSFAQSETQKEMFFKIIDSDANRLEEALNEQLFKNLALVNFGTEDFPLFTFEEVDDETKNKLGELWGNLVQKGAVTKSDSDESYLRKILGFPEKEEEEEEEEILPNEIPGNVITSDDITGNEITSDDITGNVNKSKEKGSSVEKFIDYFWAGTDEFKERQYSWYMAKGDDFKRYLRDQLAAKPWLKRVDFAGIEQSLDDHDEKFEKELSKDLGLVKQSLYRQITNIVGNRSMINVKPNEFKSLTIPAKHISSIKNTMHTNILDVINDGYNGAAKEIPKKEYEKLILPGMDKTEIEKFFKSKAEFFITGVLQQDVLNAVNLELQNAIKYDKTLKATIEALEENTDLVAVLPLVDAAGRPVNVPQRIKTIVRTNTSDALNQARESFFNTKDMQGFIVSKEYSAVIDSDTTDICEQLNGHVKKDWSNYTPPNHYNCRSILVAVTILDEWDGKDYAIPTRLKPLKGFG